MEFQITVSPFSSAALSKALYMRDYSNPCTELEKSIQYYDS